MVEQVRASHAGARGQLRYLYQRELEFNAQIVRLEHALAEARRAQRSPVEGYARTESVAGCWPDGWFSGSSTIEFVPSRALRAVEATFWAPPALVEQVISLSWPGGAAEVSLRGGQRHQVRLPMAAKAGAPVCLRMHAEHTWMPSSGGDSDDQRPLAFRVLALTLDHG